MKNNIRVLFRGGKIVSAIPMIFFIFWAVIFSLLGAGTEELFIIGMIIGLVLGLFFCKSKWSDYADVLIDGMTQRIAIIAILAYFWAGMFSQLLSVGGFVNGLIWLGLYSNATGGLFVVFTFILACLFATATGTAYGTITTFATLMLPAGVTLGADPLLLIGAIISGGIFGDNIAPISDTTIISATTQETDIPGVVRSRFKYAITAAIPAAILFFIMGNISTNKVGQTDSLNNISEKVGPQGLVLIVPFIIVLIAAFLGNHILTSLTWGIVSSMIILPFLGVKLKDIININFDTSSVGGALVDGISGYFPLSILLLFILSGAYIMEASGLMDEIKKYFVSIIQGSVKLAELSMYGVTALFSILITHNAAAGLTVSTFIKDIGKEYNIHPYRRANILDSLTSSLAGVIPWGGHILLMWSTLKTLSNKYDFIHVFSPIEIVPYIFHGWLLPITMLIAVVTSWGLRYNGAKGEEVKKNPYKTG